MLVGTSPSEEATILKELKEGGWKGWEPEKKMLSENDYTCQVCQQGDYEKDNMIVFCSLCSIAAHQRCIYMPSVPSCHWICDVCSAFGRPGINLPCALCGLRGGIMKPTVLRATEIKQNPAYSALAKQFATLQPPSHATAETRFDKDLKLEYNYFKPETHS